MCNVMRSRLAPDIAANSGQMSYLAYPLVILGQEGGKLGGVGGGGDTALGEGHSEAQGAGEAGVLVSQEGGHGVGAEEASWREGEAAWRDSRGVVPRRSSGGGEEGENGRDAGAAGRRDPWGVIPQLGSRSSPPPVGKEVADKAKILKSLPAKSFVEEMWRSIDV